MELSLFPPTFRDTLSVAKWFNNKQVSVLSLMSTMMIRVVKRMRIDSLCVIQKPNDGWEREAPTMCDVYQNAYLNISADYAVDARGGCFCDRYHASVNAFKLHMKPHRALGGFRSMNVIYSNGCKTAQAQREIGYIKSGICMFFFLQDQQGERVS